MTLKIIIPEETVNYVYQPSWEDANIASDWQASPGVVLARSLDYARFGKASLHVTCDGSAQGQGVRFDVANMGWTRTPVTISAYVRGRGVVQAYLRLNNTGTRHYGPRTPLSPHFWKRIWVTGQVNTTVENDARLYVITPYGAPNPADFYLDACQMELKGHPTTYCDGDMELELRPHDGNPFFEWAGRHHDTRSTRSRTFRMGGKIEELSQGLDYDLFPTEGDGLGMPPMAIASQIFAGGERAIIQDIRATPRTINLTFHARRNPRTTECDPMSYQYLHRARQALESAMKPDLTMKPQSFVLRYENGNGCPMDLEAVYDAGLEWSGDLRQAYHNEFSVRLIGPNPYWVTDSQDQVEMQVNTTIVGDHAYLVARLSGEWDGFGSADFPIRVLAVAPDGTVYAGGDFTQIGGVAASRVARWDGTTWTPLGIAGGPGELDDGSVYAIAFAFDGDMYLGGSFTTCNGGLQALGGVVRYRPNADSFHPLVAANPGVNSDVNALAVNNDGDVYVGGAFTQTTSAVAAYRIVLYDESADGWVQIGTFDGLNSDVEALCLDLDGETLYIGGQFTNEFSVGGAAQLPYVCKWDGTTFSAMGESGPNGAVLCLAMGLDGRLYLGGEFTTCGFWNAIKVAVWNRKDFYPLGGDGDGLTGGTRVKAVAIDSKGNVCFAGDFTGATNDDLCDYLAVWNGTRFAHLDVDLGHEALALCYRYDKLFVGYNGASVTSIADVQEVTSEGEATAYPILDVLGPLTLRYLENQETGKAVRFNLQALAGERVIVDLRPGYLKAVSDVRGNLMFGIMADSDFGDFAILPGRNRVALFGTGGNGNEEVVLRWQLNDWSFDDLR